METTSYQEFNNDSILVKKLIEFNLALQNRGQKISSSEPSYKIGVVDLPKLFKDVLISNLKNDCWAFEGSVGRGTWSRTPWIAVYDQRATSRASDGFFVAVIFAEDRKTIFLTMMNSSSKHFNYVPFRLSVDQVKTIASFVKGPISKFQLSGSGRGMGPEFESSSLLWKKYDCNMNDLVTFKEDFISLCKYYFELVQENLNNFPTSKPFRANPFLLK